MESFGAIVLVYRQIDYLDACLQAAAGHFDRIVCMYTDAPFTAYNLEARAQFGGDDGSRDVLLQHAQTNPCLQVVEGRWDSEEDMRTEALSLFKRWGIDYTYILDADEIYPDDMLDKIKNWIISHRLHSRFKCRYRNLFKRMDYEIEADDLWHNVCYRTRDIVSFDQGRTIAIPHISLPEEFFFWHFGWVLPDARMYEKVNTYSHAHELPAQWYQEKWLQWTPETTELCARNKWQWRGTKPIDPHQLPRVLFSHPLYPRA